MTDLSWKLLSLNNNKFGKLNQKHNKIKKFFLKHQTVETATENLFLTERISLQEIPIEFQ